MKRKFSICCIIVYCIMLLMGITFILRAPEIGENQGNASIDSSGIISDEANRIANNVTKTYQIAGLALTFVGGIGTIVLAYGIENKRV